MREIKFKDVDSIEPGTILTFVRGTTGEPGYGKMVFVLDTAGNPNYRKFSVTESTVKDYIRNMWVVSVND